MRRAKRNRIALNIRRRGECPDVLRELANFVPEPEGRSFLAEIAFTLVDVRSWGVRRGG